MRTRIKHLGMRLRLRARRGSALMLTMVFTFAMGGLAISAIYMAGSTSILSKLYDRERDYRYAAEWALSIGKSRLMTDTSFALPDSLYVQILNGSTVTDATGQAVPRVMVDLYAGVGGSSTGQYGRFVEMVAVAYDNGGARHVRRLQLQAENFARYAMFTDQWSPGCYTTGEIVRGRAHSNQNWVSCSTAPGPVYTDTVSAVTTVTGTAQYPSAGHRYPSAPVIPFPTVSKLSWMPGYASAGNLSLVANAYSGSGGGSRMEFVAVDLDGDGALTGAAEGYFRVFDALAATDTNRTRGGWAGNTSQVNTIISNPATGQNALWGTIIREQCGLNYVMDIQGTGVPDDTVFVPIAAHDSTIVRYNWLNDSLRAMVAGHPSGRALFANDAAANARSMDATTATRLSNLMINNPVRCYPAGDPRLMLTERPGDVGPPAPNDTLRDVWKRGGSDSTFTIVTKTGSWRPWTGWSGSSFFTGGTPRQAIEEPYLWPIHRTQNLSSQGVIYVNGSIYLSGLFRGRATLYVSGDVELIDDLTYVTNPASLPICQNLLGIITGGNMWIANNSINRPRRVNGTGTANTRFFDSDQDFFLHAVTLVGVANTTATFGVEALSQGPSTGRLCTPVPPNSAQTSGGCINQAGGVIQRRISATFSGGFTGFAENRVKDACLDVDSPPFFPLTGRYLDNEFYEIDPAQFSLLGVSQYYRRLQAGT